MSMGAAGRVCGSCPCRQQARRRRLGLRLLTVSLASLLLLSACGKKGDPRAPELTLPVPIKDLRVKAGAKGIVLTWSRPRRYMDGKKIEDLAGFVIFRKEVTSACPECPVPYRQRTVIHVEDQEKFIKKRKFRFVDRQLVPERTYHYRVFSRLLDGTLSEASNDAKVIWRP